MRRYPALIPCVLFLGAVAYAACGDDDTDNTTTTGSAGTTDTDRESPSDSAGGAGGTGGSAGRTGATGSDTATGSGRNGTTAGSGGAGGAGAVRLNDAQIASVSMAANKGEVDQNMIGVMRAKGDDARSFAQDMVDMHSAALAREMSLAESSNLTPADNPTTQMLQSKSQMTVAKLESASDDDFDGVFLQSQVEAHQMTLSLIDDTLLPSVQAAPLKDELTTMRETVTMHLDHVRDLAGQD